MLGRRFLASTLLLMALFYGLLYHEYSAESLAGRWIGAYLRGVAQGAAGLLGCLGEDVSVQGSTVLGRFPFVVVLDCAALDAQALFAASVLAFPARWRDKWLGLVAGLSSIWCINVSRLVLLYFAGARSLPLFQVLHEELMVLVVILSVCALFAVWARWAYARAQLPHRSGVTHAG